MFIAKLDIFFLEHLLSYLGGTNSNSGFILTHSHEPVSMPHIPTHEPCDKPAPYKPCKHYKRQKKDAPASKWKGFALRMAHSKALSTWQSTFNDIGSNSRRSSRKWQSRQHWMVSSR